MDNRNVIDLVIEEKQFPFYKVISRGRFSAAIEVNDQGKNTAVLVLTKEESESRLFDFDKIQNPYTVKAFELEYMSRSQAYLIYFETGQCTLEDKVNDKSFRKSPEAIECILDWIKEISMGIKQLHSNNYVHLNLKSSCIIIDSNNRAKIGGFESTRHTSTQNESFESGMESYYTPPESFANSTHTTNGIKFDIWCLAIMTVEALTINYISRKSTKITSWPEQYPILHKALQAENFRKLVKMAYPNAARAENVEKILQLIRHTVKFCPGERPTTSEFLKLLLELRFLKDIDKQMTEEKIWLKKVPLQELEDKMRYLALEKKSLPPVKFEISKMDPNDAMMGDVEFDEIKKETTEFPFEHRDLQQTKFFSSDMMTSQPHKGEIVQTKPKEKDDAKNHLRERNDEETCFSQQQKVVFQHSENFAPYPASNKLNLTEKKEDVNTDETAACLSKNNEEKTGKSIFTIKGILQKMIIWTLDEKLYTGVMQNGSFINRLSTALTG